MKQSLQSLTLVVCWQIVWFQSIQGLVSLRSSYDYDTHLSTCSWPTAYLFWVLRDKNWKRRPFFLSHKFLHVSCLISMWYKFFVAFKDHVIWHTFSGFKAMCHITCMPFDLRQNYVISLTQMNWNLSIACTNLWLLTSSYFWGILNYLMFLLFLLFPNSDVNYFLKLKLNWNLDRTHKSVITD